MRCLLALCSFSVSVVVCETQPSEIEREERARAGDSRGSVVLLLCFPSIHSVFMFLLRRHASANAVRVFGCDPSSSSPKCLRVIASQSVASLLSCPQSCLLVSVSESNDGRSRFSAMHRSARCGRLSSRIVGFDSGHSVIFLLAGKDCQSSISQAVPQKESGVESLSVFFVCVCLQLPCIFVSLHLDIVS